MSKKKCLFCCSDENELSKEHVIAQWLLNEVDIYNAVFKMYHVSAVGMLKSERVQVINKLVNGLVCEKCNSGWMSKLENKNKGGIISLMNLDSAEQIHNAISYINENHISLAKWIFKNAILFNYTVNFKKIVPRRHFIDLYNGKIPDDVFIDIGFIKDYKQGFNWSMGQTVCAITPKDIDDYSWDQNYKITFQFRHLLTKVVRYRSYHNVSYEDKGAVSLYPEFGVNREFKYFNDVFDFDMNGAIQVY